MIKLTKSNEQKVDASNIQLNALESNVIRLEKVFGERKASKLRAQQETRVIEIQETDRKRKLRNFISTEKEGSVARAVNKYTQKALGPIERVITAIEAIVLGWFSNRLPQIFDFVEKQVIPRAVTVFDGMKNLVRSVVNIAFSLKNIAVSIADSVVNFKQLDSTTIGEEFNIITDEISSMGRDFGNIVMATFGQSYEKTEGAKQAQEYVEGLGQEDKPIPSPAAPAPSPAAPSGGKLKPIHKQALDIISRPESGGSYNAMNQGTIGGKIVGSTGDSRKKLNKSLTDMTIGEVLERQRWLMNKKNPQVSNYGIYAAGRYQFIPNTLPGLVKSAGLSENDKFNQANQDLLGITLVKQRGIQPWTVGGSKYSSKDKSIVEQARKTPLGKGTGVQSRKNIGGRLTTGAVFGDTGRVSNAAGWVHGHFQDNSRTTLLNNTFPVVKKLLQQGVSVFITGGGADIALSKNMSDAQLKEAISKGIDKHSNRTRGYYAVDVSVPRGTKVPIALEDVRAAGDASGVSGLIPGTSTFIGHLTASSVSGTPEQIAQTKKEMSTIAAAPSSPKQGVSQQMPYDKPQGNTIIMAQQPAPPQMPQMPVSMGGGSNGGVDAGTLLNNMQKARFLTQLAYT